MNKRQRVKSRIGAETKCREDITMQLYELLRRCSEVRTELMARE